MSEVKGTLLTLILTLAVFATVFAVVKVAVSEKAVEVSDKITDAGKESSTKAQHAAGTGVSALRYTY